jgi:hypothetical protein
MTIARAARALLLTLLLTAAGCGEDVPDLPTAPTTDATVPVTDLFQGTIAPGGQRFYSFRVLTDRDVSFMLASLTGADGRPLDVTVTLGVGIPQGTGCAVTRSTGATAGLKAQFGHGSPVGTYCINIAAPANLPGPAFFALRIRQEPSELPDAVPGVVTFDSQLAPNGSSTRTFRASRPGDVSITLESLGPQASRVGLVVGLPPLTGSGCVPSRFVEVSPGGGPHLALPVDIGTYCVSVVDVGAQTGSVAFQVRIGHP